MSPERIKERMAYWKNIPRDLWDKDEIIEISNQLAKLTLVEWDQMDQFVADLIKEHNLVLTENQKLFIQNSRMKHTIKQLTSRDN